VQDQVLGRAGTQTASQLRASLRRAVLRVDPEGAAQRHEERRKDRRVELIPLPDAMAQLSAYLPAEQAIACYQRLDTLAGKARAPEDQRSADERRADVFVDLLLESGAAVRVEVQVTVPADTLLGTNDHPGELAGYGTIPAALARRLAEDPRATWRRLLTDVNPRSYTISHADWSADILARRNAAVSVQCGICGRSCVRLTAGRGWPQDRGEAGGAGVACVSADHGVRRNGGGTALPTGGG
jgi:hypothetical protein